MARSPRTASSKLHALNRSALRRFIRLYRGECGAKPRTEFQWVLHTHLGAALALADSVAQLLRPETATAAAALARSVVEVAYSACYIALAPKSRRQHRIARFGAFASVQSRWFHQWQQEANLIGGPGSPPTARMEENARTALSEFKTLEADLRVGWSGQRPSAMLMDGQITDKVIDRLRMDYQALSFFVHPTPLGMMASLTGVNSRFGTCVVSATVRALDVTDMLYLIASAQKEPSLETIKRLLQERLKDVARIGTA